MTSEYEMQHRRAGRAAYTSAPDPDMKHPSDADLLGEVLSTASPMRTPLHNIRILAGLDSDVGVDLILLRRRALEGAVRRLVDARMDEYFHVLDRMINSAVQRSTSSMDLNAASATGGMARVQHYDNAGHADAEREITKALSNMKHVVSAAYVQRENDYWSLFITHDSDRRGDITEQIVDKIIHVESITSMPLLEPHIMHVSDTSYTPPEATPLFPKR